MLVVERGLMMTTTKDGEGPRLYSSQERMPVDVIAPQHQVIHVDLDAWGRWCREKYQQGECESLEHNYDNTGGRETKIANVSLPENPRHRQIDQVVRYMRMNMNQHGETIRMFYAGSLRNESRRRKGRPAPTLSNLRYDPCSPRTICRVLRLRYEDFAGFMFDCRAAVLNLLRRNGN